MHKRKKLVYYKYIKIIDNDNFMCLKDDTKLMSINIKTGEVIKLFEFTEEKINNLLYYGNKYITLNTNNKIKILEKSSDIKFNCLTDISLIKEKDEILFIFLLPDKNILIVNNDKEKITYFIELDKISIITKINDLSYRTLYQLNENLIMFHDYHYSILNIYDFNKKELINKKIFHRFSLHNILTLPKKEIFLMAIQSYRNGKDVKCFEIIGLNYNCQEIFILNQPIYHGHFGFKYFEEKNKKEDIILIYETYGPLNFVSLIA